jgi:class 3 adenylate cyclase/pimeloyl-ACP methyl ester carboxylesterase
VVPEVPETRYASNADGDHVAYQVVGDGPIDVLVNRPTLFPVDLMWDEPRLVYFLNRLSSFCRHIWFDSRGTGASDGIAHGDVRLLEGITDDMVAVLDAVGVQRAALLGLGVSSGVLFAAAHPDRTTALVLYNATARFRRADDYPEGISDDEIERRLQLGPGVTNPGVASIEQVAPALADDVRFRRWFDRAQRLTLGPKEAAWRLKGSYEIDVRDVLGAVQAPTLVAYRSGAGRPAHSRYLADHIAGAKLVELEGDDVLPFTGESGQLLDAIEQFLTGQQAPAPADRMLATLLFTDVVDSTQLAGRMGDRRWRELLRTHDAVVRDELDRFRGREVKFTGDGFLTTFDGPARAIRCACAIRDALHAIGLEVRAGVHTGEIERHGDDVAGIAVHVAQRVMTRAQPGQVLVSRTVADLIAGSDIDLDDLGEHDLKGVPGPWRLFTVAT